MVRMTATQLRFLFAIVSLLALTGCASWKKADAAAGLAMASHVDTTKVNGQMRVRIRSRGAAVLIDLEGGRVTDFHLQPRPRWRFVRDRRDADRMAMEFDPTRSGPNLIAPPGWSTSVAPGTQPADPLAHSVYWRVDSSVNRVDLLSDAEGGLRWRKRYELDERTNALTLTVWLENTTGHAKVVDVASVLPTTAEPRTEGPVQRFWADDQWLSRKLLEGPAGAATEGDGFRFDRQRIAPRASLKWVERWRLTRGPATTPPAEPGGSPREAGPGAERVPGD
jgi:hypothetical protein